MRLKETTDQCNKVFAKIQTKLAGEDGASMKNAIEFTFKRDLQFDHEQEESKELVEAPN